MEMIRPKPESACFCTDGRVLPVKGEDRFVGQYEFCKFLVYKMRGADVLENRTDHDRIR